MKRAPKLALMALWLSLFPVLFAALWVRSPSLWFINLPAPAWAALSTAFGVECCEQGAALEFFVGVVLGFVVAAGALLAFLVVCKKRRIAIGTGDRTANQ